MKNIIQYIVLIFSINLTAQEALYISTQTREYTIIEGSGSAETDDNESGVCSCSSTGPIKYKITPTSIGTDESITVNGWVQPDPDAAPEAGTSAPASILCDCTWNWLTWDDITETKTKAMSADTSGTREYEVFSLLLELNPTNYLCGEYNLSVKEKYPEGGKVTWDTPWGPFDGDSPGKQQYKEEYIGKKATATYTVEKISYSVSFIINGKILPDGMDLTILKMKLTTGEGDNPPDLIDYMGPDIQGLSQNIIDGGSPYDIGTALEGAMEVMLIYYMNCVPRSEWPYWLQ